MRCRYCYKILSIEEEDYGVCYKCRNFLLDDEDIKEEGYYIGRNPWDDQAPYSEDYDDQYCF
jgi:DNA-directed RNA polymerase subunit L